MMMGVWLATSFIGGFLAGWLGSLWSAMDKTQFFLMIAAIAAAAGVAIAAFNRPLRGDPAAVSAAAGHWRHPRTLHYDSA